MIATTVKMLNLAVTDLSTGYNDLYTIGPFIWWSSTFTHVGRYNRCFVVVVVVVCLFCLFLCLFLYLRYLDE